jgi:hypothetical protein
MEELGHKGQFVHRHASWRNAIAAIGIGIFLFRRDISL